MSDTPREKSWVEVAPKAIKYSIVGTTAVTNSGPLPVMGFAFKTLNDEMITVNFLSSIEGIKKFKTSFLRAYDIALREAKTINQSLKDIDE
jgi:hypothetical protein